MTYIGPELAATADWNSRDTARVFPVKLRVHDGAPMDLDAAFADLVTHHQDRALRLALRLVSGDHAAAEDVVQEAYLRAHRGLARFRGDAKLTTWFDRIVVREAYRHHRRPWRRWMAGEDPEAHFVPEPAAESDPMLRGRVRDALSKLTSHQRTVFVLMHLEGYTAREVADIMGRSLGTVKTHLHRALKRLRADLADHVGRSGSVPATGPDGRNNHD